MVVAWHKKSNFVSFDFTRCLFATFCGYWWGVISVAAYLDALFVSGFYVGSVTQSHLQLFFSS
jgi:hypothetical protein